MLKSKWFFHPLFVFIFSLIALGTSLFLYISTYIKVNDAFREFVFKHKLDGKHLLDSDTWVMILITSVLVGIIITGLAIIFIYYQKMIKLYRIQQNFINGFTHELKTPVASLNLFIDTFLKHGLSREQQIKYLNFMKKDTVRLADNINQILDLAKIEDRKSLQNLYPRDVNRLIAGFISKNRDILGTLEVDFKPTNEKTMLDLDNNLFDMVLMNIFTNAIRYNDKPIPKIDVRIKTHKNQVSVSFKDNGIGMVKSEQKKVFKKFYQIGLSAKGTGLGLYMVANIIRLHKGTVEMKSEGPGLGSKLSLHFKVASKVNIMNEPVGELAHE